MIMPLLIVLLLATNLYTAYLWYNASEGIRVTESKIKSQEANQKTLEFTKLFIAKVLKSQGEVSFENRLKLENAVRELSDETVLTQWKKFTDSKDEAEAQSNVKDLLDLLVNKIK